MRRSYRADKPDGFGVLDGLGIGNGVPEGLGNGVGEPDGLGNGIGVPVGSGRGKGVPLGSGIGTGITLGSGIGIGTTLGAGVGETFGFAFGFLIFRFGVAVCAICAVVALNCVADVCRTIPAATIPETENNNVAIPKVIFLFIKSPCKLIADLCKTLPVTLIVLRLNYKFPFKPATAVPSGSAL